MKTFFALLLIAIVGWGGWYIWHDNGTDDQTALISTDTPYPTFTSLGQGGEGPEPSDIVNPTPTPTPQRTPVPTVRRTPTPTPSPAPLLVFRDVTSMNGSGENGVMLIHTNEQGQAVIDFNIVGAPAGIYQPAYIYRGASCEGDVEAVFGLNALINGSSSTVLPIRAIDLVSGSDPLRLVIHESASQMNTRFACAVVR